MIASNQGVGERCSSARDGVDRSRAGWKDSLCSHVHELHAGRRLGHGLAILSQPFYMECNGFLDERHDFFARGCSGYVRQGAYRIVYEIVDARLVVIVVKIGHRRDVYRR